MGLSDIMMKGINAVAGAIGIDVSRTLELDNAHDWNYGDLNDRLGVASDEGFRGITTAVFGDMKDEPLHITIGSDGITKVESERINGETVTIEIDRETGDVRSAVITDDKGEVYTCDVKATIECGELIGTREDADGRVVERDSIYETEDGSREIRCESFTYSEGRIEEREVQTWNLDTQEGETEHTRYTYRDNGLFERVEVETIDHFSGDRSKVGSYYNERGELRHSYEVYSSPDGRGGDVSREVHTIYENNWQDRVERRITSDGVTVVEHTAMDRDGEATEREITEYSLDGEVSITETKYTGDRGEYTEHHIVDGKEVSSKTFDGERITIVERDSDGKIESREVTTVDGKLVFHSEFVYEGDKIIETVYDADGNVAKEVESIPLVGYDRSFALDDGTSGIDGILVTETYADGNEETSLYVRDEKFICSDVHEEGGEKRLELRPETPDTGRGWSTDSFSISLDTDGNVVSIEKEVHDEDGGIRTTETKTIEYHSDGSRTDTLVRTTESENGDYQKIIEVTEWDSNGYDTGRVLFVGHDKEDCYGSLYIAETDNQITLETYIGGISEERISDAIENPQNYDRTVTYTDREHGIRAADGFAAGQETDIDALSEATDTGPSDIEPSDIEPSEPSEPSEPLDGGLDALGDAEQGEQLEEPPEEPPEEPDDGEGGN